MFMKYLNKLWVRIIIAIVVGFVLAGGYTDIAYSLPTIYTEQGGAGGVLYESVLSHPRDLLNNKENSLVRFSTTFFVVSIITFSALSIPSLTKRKNT